MSTLKQSNHSQGGGAQSANQQSAPEPATPTIPVAGIGASAGGVEALKTFFNALAEKLGVAFVVVHLSPEHRSAKVPYQPS